VFSRLFVGCDVEFSHVLLTKETKKQMLLDVTLVLRVGGKLINVEL